MPRPDPKAPIEVCFELDGKTIEATARAGRSALDFLRQDCQQTHLVPGCSPQGLCGCCAVMVNGKPKLSCTLRVKNLNGKSIQTLRGLDPKSVAKLQSAFAAHGASQCGYCTPGILLQSAALLERNPTADDSDIDKALNMHLCRCTGYSKIKSAIRSVQKEQQSTGTGLISPISTLSNLGKSLRVADIRYPNTLYAVPVFSTELGELESIETELGPEQFVSMMKLFRSNRHQIPHAGVPIGFTLNACLDTARLNATEVQCAIQTTKPQLSFDTCPTKLQSVKLEYGEANPETWIAQSVEAPMQEPAYLEPDALICTPTDNGHHLTVAGVNPHRLKRWLAEAGFPNVDIESLPCGASYGGRNINELARCAIKLSQLRKHPIAIQLSFEHAQRMHHKSPPQQVHLQLGLDKNGMPCALKGEINLLGGCSPDQKMAQNLAEAILTPYAIPNIEIDISVYQSAHPPATLLRDKGLMAFTIALEKLITKAAKRAGFDPLSYRGKSLVDPKFTPVLKAIASKVVDQKQAEFGVGLAMCRPSENARVQINLTARAGTGIEIEIPVPESGQNLESQLMSQASIATGLPFEVFSCRCDTKSPLAGVCHDEDLPALASIALAKACAKLEADLDMHTIEALDGHTWTGHAQGDEATELFAAVLSTQGQGERPELFVAGGSTNPNSATEGLIEGAAHMGLSATLGEAVRFDKNGIPLEHLRTLNLLKAKNSPAIQSNLLGSEFGTGGGVAKMAAGAAVVGLSMSEDGQIVLPLSETEQAKSLGIRVR